MVVSGDAVRCRAATGTQLLALVALSANTRSAAMQAAPERAAFGEALFLGTGRPAASGCSSACSICRHALFDGATFLERRQCVSPEPIEQLAKRVLRPPPATFCG